MNISQILLPLLLAFFSLAETTYRVATFLYAPVSDD